jgi:phage repressor protein C with HTH and peptisase S24 domain
MQTTCVTVSVPRLINSLFMNDDDEDVSIPAGPLRERLEGKRGDKAEFARRMTISPARLTNWLARGIPERQLPKVCATLGITVGTYRQEAGLPERVGYDSRDEALPVADERYVDIPVYDVVASMGLGAAMPDYDTVVDNLRLTKTWVQRHIPGASHTSNLAVISGYGDSMKPTFDDGDILLVDRAVHTLTLDAVYVLSFNDQLFIKRIQRRPDGSVAIISDNKVYDPIVVPSKEKDSIQVLGRILFAWNGKRL